MRRFAYWHEAVLALVLVALLVGAGIVDPGFVSPRVQLGLIDSVWELALVAVPMTLIILTGGIDLSVGSAMSLSAVCLGLGFEAGLPVGLCAALAVLVGTLAGLLNAVFVAKLKIHPLIVTLATMSAFYGLAEGVSRARPISGFPAAFTDLSSVRYGPLALTGWFVVAVCLVAIVVLSRTVAGRSLPAMGFNEVAARFSGIPVDRVKLAVYTLAGTSAGMAALFYASRRNTAKADVGQGLELDVVTAVVLGGTSITGGRGGIIGTVLGVLVVHETRQFVSWHWEKDEVNLLVIGSVLILAVLGNRLFERREKGAQ